MHDTTSNRATEAMDGRYTRAMDGPDDSGLTFTAIQVSIAFKSQSLFDCNSDSNLNSLASCEINLERSSLSL